jgi:hypothetical protein
MNDQEFNKIVDERCDAIVAILTAKATEYARGDRMSNFKTAAALAKTTPEMALRGMLAKHIVSIWDLIDDIEKGWQPAESMNNLAKEKIGDAINYLILLEGLIEERAMRNALNDVNARMTETHKKRR